MHQLAHRTSESLERTGEVLVIGGDHSSAIGTWSGVAHTKRHEGHIGLIWVDAHMVSDVDLLKFEVHPRCPIKCISFSNLTLTIFQDAHTPQTSPSGNIHGMPVAHLLGFGDRNLTTIG